jgi:hypothetical protein
MPAERQRRTTDFTDKKTDYTDYSGISTRVFENFSVASVTARTDCTDYFGVDICEIMNLICEIRGQGIIPAGDA